MKAYVACCNLDWALNVVKFFKEAIATSWLTADLPAATAD